MGEYKLSPSARRSFKLGCAWWALAYLPFPLVGGIAIWRQLSSPVETSDLGRASVGFGLVFIAVVLTLWALLGVATAFWQAFAPTPWAVRLEPTRLLWVDWLGRTYQVGLDASVSAQLEEDGLRIQWRSGNWKGALDIPNEFEGFSDLVAQLQALGVAVAPKPAARPSAKRLNWLSRWWSWWVVLLLLSAVLLAAIYFGESPHTSPR